MYVVYDSEYNGKVVFLYRCQDRDSKVFIAYKCLYIAHGEQRAVEEEEASKYYKEASKPSHSHAQFRDI